LLKVPNVVNGFELDPHHACLYITVFLFKS
jgi:hypothetical protein